MIFVEVEIVLIKKKITGGWGVDGLTEGRGGVNHSHRDDEQEKPLGLTVKIFLCVPIDVVRFALI